MQGHLQGHLQGRLHHRHRDLALASETLVPEREEEVWEALALRRARLYLHHRRHDPHGRGEALSGPKAHALALVPLDPDWERRAPPQ